MAGTVSRTQVLKDQLADSGAALRPVITYVNGDVAWLVSFPRPEVERSAGGKAYYHAVIDPWFGQPALGFSSMILEMTLGRDPGLACRAALEIAIAEIEAAAGISFVLADNNSAVDAIFIASPGEDHCHKDSLLQFSSTTPIFAVKGAAGTIASWNHFATIVTMSSTDPSTTSWKDGHPGSPLPPWLTVFLPTVTRFNNFGLALITSVNESENELILMAPHGISADEACLKGFAASATPAVKMLALLAPLKESYIFGTRTVMGAKDALSIAQATEVRYYVRNGDFVSLKYGGLLSYFISDVPHDLQWGVDELRKELGPDKVLKQPNLVEVENGGSFVLV